ncbi:MAG TPA: cyclase family protein, partial [Solirubrobacteraceae bacterium]|nr:cyclase family protein [Solirubrobacteraceae bacterium]
MSSTHASEVSGLLGGLASGAVEIVDLTQPLSETTPLIQLPEPFANTPPLAREEISRYDDRGPAWAWYTLTLGEHTGTHVDAPIHWVTGKDGADIGSIPPERLVGPACVIDKTAETEAAGGDYLLTVADLEAWEAEHGRIPDGAWVLLRSGWGSRAHDQDLFLNVGENGPQTPGPDVEAARWLAGERAISGFGTETVGIDAGSAGSMEPPFPLHNFLLGSGKLGLTQLANLERLPTSGALLVVAPLRLVGGT